MKLPRRVRQAGAYIFGRGSLREESGDRQIQTAALPWRCTADGKLEILLVTSRDSPRWLPPKGWPMRGKNLAEAAAQEAYEEAGVTGRIEAEPIGRFDHVKQHPLLGRLDLTVLLHPLAVERELSEWPERELRQRGWFAAEEAAAKVVSQELRRLIAAFARSGKNATDASPGEVRT